MTDYSAGGYYTYGVFMANGKMPWIATTTRSDAQEILNALNGNRLGPVFEVREL